MPEFDRLRFREALAVLARHQVEFIVIGGVGALLQGSPLATFDLDIVHRRSEENIAKLLGALKDLEAVYRQKPERIPDAALLSSRGHHLLKTACGALDILGEAGLNSSYDSLLPFVRMTSLEYGTDIQVLDLAKLIEIKEETANDKDRAMLPILRQVLRERDSS